MGPSREGAPLFTSKKKEERGPGGKSSAEGATFRVNESILREDFGKVRQRHLLKPGGENAGKETYDKAKAG